MINVGKDEAKDKRMELRTGNEFTGADNLEEEREGNGASWREVLVACCCHSPFAWAMIIFRLFWAFFFLFFFILGLDLLGVGAQVLTGCAAGALFGDDQNPVSSLMIGILVTCLLQSSSTTTSIFVAMVGAGAIVVEQGIYMVMGANIGTSITNTIVAMGQIGDGDQLERAFAGATVHDMFNFMNCAIFFPIEVVSGMFAALTAVCVKNATTGKDGESRQTFITKYIEPIGQKLLIVNKSITKDVAAGGTCAEYYPIVCENPAHPTGDTCNIGLIACSKDAGLPCPLLFQDGATVVTDQTGGLVAFFVGLTLLFICLGGLVTILSQMLMGVSSNIIYKATDINGYLAMLIGCALTVAVQSSSITTSALTPLVGMGLIRLEQMYPITLGANIGTTVTGLLAAFVATGTEALQVALAHLFFNVFGIVIWYPIPFMRRIPMHAARQLGKATRAWKGFPFVYIGIMFFAIPGFLLALSSMFSTKVPSEVVVASIILVVFVFGVVGLTYWWIRMDGRRKTSIFFAKRRRRVEALETLPYDMTWARRRIRELQQYSGISPAEAVKTSKRSHDGKEDVYANVAAEMGYVTEMIKKLVDHLGLEKKDTEGIGRFFNKENEKMGAVDMSGKKNYITMIIAIGAICMGLYLWAVIHLFQIGTVSARGMGGYLLVMLAIFIIERLFGRCSGNAAALSEAAYIDRMLKKECKLTYKKNMAQMTADVNELAAQTQIEMPMDGDTKDDENDAAKKNQEMSV